MDGIAKYSAGMAAIHFLTVCWIIMMPKPESASDADFEEYKKIKMMTFIMMLPVYLRATKLL